MTRGHALRDAFAVLAVVAATVALPLPATSQASPYVPTLDPAYRDLDALVAGGLVSGIILGQRPYSRMTFARVTAEARRELDSRTEGAKARFTEAVERIEVRFATDLGQLRAAGSDACPEEARFLALRGASLDGAWAASPSRPITVRQADLSGIDADLNPFLQRNQGRVLADGWALGGEGTLDLGLDRRLAGEVQPRLWVAYGAAGDASADVTLMRGYARALLGNLSVDVGRNHVPHGHARDYGPVSSNNARGMDMIRLSMERPGHLPWIFRALGPVSFTGYVADMGRNQDTPGSKLFVFEGAIRPHRNLELGGALLNHQFGEGAPEASFGQRIRDIFFILHRRPFYIFPSVDGQFSDKVMALDARLSIPSRGLDAYLEMMTTDDHDLFAAAVQGLWNDAAWTAGLRLVGLGIDGRTDLWAEATRTGILPYTHHQFTSGLTLDRRVIGSPLGPLGTGVQGGVDWTGLHQTLSLGGAWERYQGDTYWDPPDRYAWRFRLSDNPDEVRIRTTLDWTRQPAPSGLRTTIRLGYEHVTRFDFTDRNRSNFLAQVSVGYVW